MGHPGGRRPRTRAHAHAHTHTHTHTHASTNTHTHAHAHAHEHEHGHAHAHTHSHASAHAPGTTHLDNLRRQHVYPQTGSKAPGPGKRVLCAPGPPRSRAEQTSRPKRRTHSAAPRRQRRLDGGPDSSATQSCQIGLWPVTGLRSEGGAHHGPLSAAASAQPLVCVSAPAGTTRRRIARAFSL